MDGIGFVFPGQGSQRVGMGGDLATAYPELVDTFYRPADEILDLPLSRLCWEGPAESLRDTSITQPAVFLTSLCTWQVLRRRGVTPAVVAGHSLGEYMALVSVGVLDWTDALRLVRLRGQLMAGVNERTPGAMAAILGLGLARVEEICAQAVAETGQVVEIANDNEPTQVVVSGQVKAVEWAMDAARDAGAKRAKALEVGAPFHCSMMGEIEERFAAALADVDFRDPNGAMVSSVTAEAVTSGAEAERALRRQLTGRVRWTGTVTRMAAMGVDSFVEVGPGKVLGGLCRRIEPRARTYSTHDARQLDTTRDALTAAPSTPPGAAPGPSGPGDGRSPL